MFKAYLANTIHAFEEIDPTDADYADLLTRSTKAVRIANNQSTPPLDTILLMQQSWDVGPDENQPTPEAQALGSLLDGQHMDRKIVLARNGRGNTPSEFLFVSNTMLVGMCTLTADGTDFVACNAVGVSLPPDTPPPSGPPGEDAQPGE
jgi:hypothetical protein